MATNASRKHTWLAASVLVVGLALLTFMVTGEGEPGALPLALVAIGSTWLLLARRGGRREDDRR